ncbi:MULTISPECIES: hypothetical protein [unclassified Pseudomonas]|jgi:hypothetical protein|uniref:hypothetical protein n=1 Tax=unclassified Pseudomonas TaxID=196821 RepID=UPI000778B35A|nr:MULTISPECIES: hypothetical protein [unclassified Pseudomonas]KYC14102.1 hypothetical protein WM94_28385 [Pseudomonas sp. ABFPK]
MTSKEQLVAALQGYSDRRARIVQQSIFQVMELQAQQDAVFKEIKGWLSGIQDITVSELDGGQLPFLATVFKAKHLKIQLANTFVQFNPFIHGTSVAFTIVGLSTTDVRMEADFTLSSDGHIMQKLTAELFCQQLANLVNQSGW